MSAFAPDNGAICFKISTGGFYRSGEGEPVRATIAVLLGRCAAFIGPDGNSFFLFD
jgi:hypothetical protein